MKRIQSPPLLRLILIGFFAVALPLIGAIVTAIAQVDQLAKDSGRALVSVQKNTTTSGLLVDRVTEMERSARQYQALADETYKDLYNEHRHEVLILFAQLSQSNQDEQLQDTINKAMQSEIATNKFVDRIGKSVSMRDLEIAFAALREHILEIVRMHNTIARDMSNAMPEQANRLQRLLMSQAVLVIPVSAGLAILFVVLISRPLRQINQGIRSLGHGALTEPVRVTGTSDLEELGRQLDLLRIRLVELEAQKAQFLRNVSHELKTPLTNIREGAELLLHTNRNASDSEQTTITRILRDNSIRLQRMIEELLRFGADGDIMTQQMEEAVAFDQVVNDTVEKHALAVAARSVTLKTELAPVMVTGDSKRLAIIVDNLLSNAVKYTPSGGHINIELKKGNIEQQQKNITLKQKNSEQRKRGNDVVLDVHDSGPGIAEKDKPYLFEWFFTGPRPPGSIIVGTGMGLAIAQEYAQQHNGQISLLASLRGAHFRLLLKGKNNDV